MGKSKPSSFCTIQNISSPQGLIYNPVQHQACYWVTRRRNRSEESKGTGDEFVETHRAAHRLCLDDFMREWGWIVTLSKGGVERLQSKGCSNCEVCGEAFKAPEGHRFCSFWGQPLK